MDAKRYNQLRATPKADLARMHAECGGLLTVREYMKWTKEELVQAVMEDESGA